MTTQLIIARHGNTFDTGDIIRRVGVGTDIPLSSSGRQQAECLGLYLKEQNLLPSKVFCSQLQRTRQTAQLALQQAKHSATIEPLAMFNEIDYGVDENQSEEKVVARLGKEALQKWDQEAIVPHGWNVDPNKIIYDWQQFAEDIEKNYCGQVILVVTSNGIARFAPHLIQDFASFQQKYNIKMSTGALSLLCKEIHETPWHVLQWNYRPLIKNQ